MKKVSIIEYEAGNILNVLRAFQYLGASPKLISTSNELNETDCLVLPGVGSFHKAMESLRKRNLIPLIKEWIDMKKPFLGICLGMQLLFDNSQEFGNHEGLSIISGEVKKLPIDREKRLPNINWAPLIKSKIYKNMTKSNIFTNFNFEKDVYFVHSYACYPVDQNLILAHSYFGSHKFTAVLKKDNVYGCQFHPERSGQAGLKILQEFLDSF